MSRRPPSRRFYVDNPAQPDVRQQGIASETPAVQLATTNPWRPCGPNSTKALGHAANPAGPPCHPRATTGCTLLMMVMLQPTTDSPWPVSNNPRPKPTSPEAPTATFGSPLAAGAGGHGGTHLLPPPGRHLCPGSDKGIPVHLCRRRSDHLQQSGLPLAFQMVTRRPYKIGWPTGSDRLLIVSVWAPAASPRPAPASRPTTSGLGQRQEPAWRPDERGLRRLGHGRTLGECRYGPAH